MRQATLKCMSTAQRLDYPDNGQSNFFSIRYLDTILLVQWRNPALLFRAQIHRSNVGQVVHVSLTPWVTSQVDNTRRAPFLTLISCRYSSASLILSLYGRLPPVFAERHFGCCPQNRCLSKEIWKPVIWLHCFKTNNVAVTLKNNPSVQWRNQPKNFGEPKCLILGE